MTDSSILPVIIIMFVATLVRVSLGFGDALISVPLLALIMPVEQATPIVVLVSITIAAVVLVKDWRKVHFRTALPLFVSTLFGIPAGLLLLTTVREAVVKTILGVVIMAFAVHSFRSRQRQLLQNDRLAWLFGLQAGVLGGAYGMSGPPLVVYGSLRGWHPENFRATLQSYFLPAGLAGMSGYWLAGLWTPAVNQFYIASLPAVGLATLLGWAANRRMQRGQFNSYVYAGLMASGAALLFQALTRG